MPAPANMSEFDAQVRLFVLLDIVREKQPSFHDMIEDVWATSNGGKRPKGEAGRMKAAGQRRGVLDVECMVPRNGKHGLFIEMEAEAGRPTKEQAARINRLNGRGYLAIVSRSWVDAGMLICNYLGAPFPANAEAMVEMRLVAAKSEMREARRQAGSCTNSYASPHLQGRRGRWTALVEANQASQ